MTMANPIDIRTGDPAEITLTTPRKQGITMEVSGGVSGDPYEGPYEVTPNEETQVLRTAQKVTQRNVVVNQIPSNYGRIARVGARLRVF